MAFQKIELNMIPHGDMPSFYASQYETGRPIIIDVLMGEDAFACDDLYVELHCRKVDNNIVTLEPDSVDGNQVTFVGTDQLFACPGKNLCEICLYADETKDTSLGSLNFFIEVEPDPLAGGLESETQIHDLYTQVEEITEQVIGDDYYDKTEVDALLDAKADASTTYTKTEVDTALNLKADKSTTYTKTETNALLAGKADASETYTKSQVDSKLSLKADKATTYTKTETDTLLGYKANLSQVYTRSQTDTLLDNKADKSTTYTKMQVDNALALKANTADLATVATTGDYDDLINKPTLPDMSQYYTKTQTDALLDQKVDESEFILATGTEDKLPYQTRPTPSNVGTRCLEKLVGVSCAFNQLVQNGDFSDASGWMYSNATISVSNNECVVTVTDTSQESRIQHIVQNRNGHVYLRSATMKANQGNFKISWYGGLIKTVSATGEYQVVSDIIKSTYADNNSWLLYLGVDNNDTPSEYKVKNVNVIDLTVLFGSEIADYIYTLESGTAGAGVSLFRQIFSENYYPYTTNTLMSVKPTSKVVKDDNNTTIATYDFGGAELRGLFKKDADGNIYADGDLYTADGTITRRYESRAYQAGDESLPDAITDGTTTVVKLATPTTETSTSYDNPQTVGAYEEFTDTRTIKMPCGHDTIYSKKPDFRYWE